MSTPLRKVKLQPTGPTISQIVSWRQSQALWLRIATDSSLRAKARENAKAQADRYEAMIRGR